MFWSLHFSRHALCTFAPVFFAGAGAAVALAVARTACGVLPCVAHIVAGLGGSWRVQPAVSRTGCAWRMLRFTFSPPRTIAVQKTHHSITHPVVQLVPLSVSFS